MQKLRYRRYALLSAVVLWALAMSGCEQKTINQIRAEPDRYANKEVSVVGTVTQSYSVLGAGAYEIEDGTGKLWVVAKKGVPREGAKVGVKGTIRDGYNLGSLVKLPEVIRSGLVMIESAHRAR
jgi:hypothetical protein